MVDSADRSAPPTKDGRRPSEVARVREFLEGKEPGLSILPVSGPGGVGKTFLVNHVIESGVGSDYLVLRADGAAPEMRGDLFAILESLFPRSLPPPARASFDYFPRVRELALEHRLLCDEALREMATSGATEDMKAAARILIRSGRAASKLARDPRVGRVLDALGKSDSELDRITDDVTTMLRTLRAFRDSTWLPGPLRDVLGVTRRNRLRNDLYALVAEELRTDLAAALWGYEGRDTLKPTHRRIPGLERLLIVLDDFELIGPTLQDFLIGGLLRQLADAPFATRMLIVGRDDLMNMHPGWEQHARRFLRPSIELRSFDRPTTEALCREAGIDEDRIDALWESTRGYPYLVGLAIEEKSAPDAEAATFLRRFVERTTRWMLPNEQAWFFKLVYLDTVDEDTLCAFFEPGEATRVQRWFEQDASVRDPTAAAFRVRPLIRDRVLRYLAVRGPKAHADNMRRATQAGGLVSS